jgi:hypothetical protein
MVELIFALLGSITYRTVWRMTGQEANRLTTRKAVSKEKSVKERTGFPLIVLLFTNKWFSLLSWKKYSSCEQRLLQGNSNYARISEAAQICRS